MECLLRDEAGHQPEPKDRRRDGSDPANGDGDHPAPEQPVDSAAVTGSAATYVSIPPEVAAAITHKYAGRAPCETVERISVECYTALARDARVTSYLPLLTERMVRERLTALVVPPSQEWEQP